MSWFDNYKKKRCSLAEAVSVVKSKDRVYVSGNAASPSQNRAWKDISGTIRSLSVQQIVRL
jgi:hypothetical protein